MKTVAIGFLDFDGMDVIDFSQRFFTMLEEVPAEFRSSAVVKASVTGDEDDVSGEEVLLSIEFTRPLTEKELFELHKEEAAIKASAIDRELEEFKRLSAKFKDGWPVPGEVV